MKTQLIMPQEIEVFYIIPVLRREMALAMKALGKKQKDIAKVLCVRESTISHYLNNKRATEIKLNDDVKKAVVESVEKINDKISLIVETQKLLKLVKESKALCEIHKVLANVPKSCDVCLKV